MLLCSVCREKWLYGALYSLSLQLTWDLMYGYYPILPFYSNTIRHGKRTFYLFTFIKLRKVAFVYSF